MECPDMTSSVIKLIGMTILATAVIILLIKSTLNGAT